MSSDIRVYVACLACYNEGRHHGEWLDATDDADTLYACVKALQEQCGHTDNDHAIHDHEGFEGYRVEEYAGLGDVSKLANLISEYGAAIVRFVENGSADLSDDDLEDKFSEAYQGEFRDVAAYAEQYLDDTGAFQGSPDFLTRYFNYEAFARDLELGGDIWTASASSGVYIFNNF